MPQFQAQVTNCHTVAHREPLIAPTPIDRRKASMRRGMSLHKTLSTDSGTPPHSHQNTMGPPAEKLIGSRSDKESNRRLARRIEAPRSGSPKHRQKPHWQEVTQQTIGWSAAKAMSTCHHGVSTSVPRPTRRTGARRTEPRALRKLKLHSIAGDSCERRG